jgi:Putative transposase
VTFKWKDYRAKADARYKQMTLDVDEFIRRFLIHVLPDGFHRIRHYGLFANAKRAGNIAVARQLLGMPAAPSSGENDSADGGQKEEEWNTCPCCGGRMVIIEVFEPGCQPHHWPTPSIGDANARSTAIVNAAFHRQSADHSVRHHRFACTRGAQNHGRGTRSAAGPVPNCKITSNTGAKSP